MTEREPHPANNGTTVTGLNERSVILCRTCLRPLTWETRTEPGYKPRTGFYDDARSDPLICFKAVDYRHEPLTDREWAYYEAGQRSVLPPAEHRTFHCDGCGQPAMNIDAHGLCRSCRDLPPAVGDDR